jgi:two-component system chemotaxis response regulator CheB
MSAPVCRVLIVDDSTIFRSQIRAALEGVAGVEVVGFAPNGRLALEQLKVREVDVVTLDLEMPELNGVETLKQMRELKMTARVIVFSSQSRSGAEATMTALGLGALDFVTKPIAQPGDNPADLIRSSLLPKIRQFMNVPTPTAAPVVRLEPKPTRYPTLGPWDFWKPKLVVIASSTGGPNALDQIFNLLRPPLNVPILIAQHMPPLFTASLADRLAAASGLPVREAVHNQPLTPGTIAIAPGDYHLRLKRSDAGVQLLLDQGPQRNSVRPAADYLFETAAELFGPACLGIVLTGMGADGCDGAQAIKQNGGRVMIQNRESCVVFGMPGAVFDAQAYDRIGTLPEIAATLGDLGVCQNNSLAKVATP